MIRRPPRSTLFPSRRSSDLSPSGRSATSPAIWISTKSSSTASSSPPRCWRSEEHTSELQSQSNLVCRLLLEKKKKKKTTLPHIKYIKNNLEYYKTSYKIGII